MKFSQQSCFLRPSQCCNICIISKTSHAIESHYTDFRIAEDLFLIGVVLKMEFQFETTIESAHRRLEEEMGFDCEIEEAFEFIYKKELDKGLTEHELDHVFIGNYEGKINVNPNEVNDYEFIPIQEVLNDVNQHPKKYTEWFKICLEEVVKRVL